MYSCLLEKQKEKKDTANGNEARVFYYTESIFGLAELESYLSRVSKDFRIFNFLWISIGQNFYGFACVNFGRLLWRYLYSGCYSVPNRKPILFCFDFDSVIQ